MVFIAPLVLLAGTSVVILLLPLAVVCTVAGEGAILVGVFGVWGVLVCLCGELVCELGVEEVGVWFLASVATDADLALSAFLFLEGKTTVVGLLLGSGGWPFGWIGWFGRIGWIARGVTVFALVVASILPPLPI